MRKSIYVAVVAALAFGAAQASAQTAVLDFEDGTDQGFGTGFGNNASANFTIANIGGSNRMLVPNSGFQDAGRETSNPAEPFYLALLAASANEAGYTLSYDYYIDTAATPGANGTFLQLGTYFNTGNSDYFQDFPAAGKDLELNGTQLSSGQVFQGTISETFAAKGFNIAAGQTFFRPGLIINGDGAPNVYFDNIRVAPVPEPTTLAALGAAVTGLAMRRRRAI